MARHNHELLHLTEHCLPDEPSKELDLLEKGHL